MTLLARRFPWMRQWNVHTLKPRSMRELLSLCHRRNIDHVRVVGYNNGVDPFRPSPPGKDDRLHDPLPPNGSRRPAYAQGGLRGDGAQCPGLPGHESIRNSTSFQITLMCALGTSFFVPIHGSAVDYSTVADTICRVVLYDPDSDRIISAARDDAAFREHVYNQQSRVVVLRLYLLAEAEVELLRPS